MPAQTPAPPVPPITSPDSLDLLWRAHLDALAKAAEAQGRKEQAAGEASTRRWDLDKIRAEIAELQAQAATIEADALRFQVAADDAAAAEARFRTTAHELGATVEFNVAQGAVEHPAARVRRPVGEQPLDDTGAFRALKEAQQP